MATPSPESYHIGWISPVDTQYVAACELLDEAFQTPRLPHRDDNAHTCGRVGDHNVVIACLPQGKYGLTSAATVASNMLRSFPAIRFGLMEASSITGSEKTIQDKKFERTGSLSPPPLVLLTALQKLSALHERQGHQIAQTVDQMVGNNSRLRRYQHPDPATDVLFQSSFLHTDSDRPCVEVCGAGRIVQRSVRDSDQDDPAVHYGLIASADRLMKDAHVRDRLAKDEGVLCFEMEAAGLMDHFPCVITRGICDYSDTHQNDLWQGYAAATAAAYAQSNSAIRFWDFNTIGSHTMTAFLEKLLRKLQTRILSQ